MHQWQPGNQQRRGPMPSRAGMPAVPPQFRQYGWAAVLIAVAAVAGCGGSPTATASPAAVHSAATAPSPSCTLKAGGPDYIVRDDLPGASVMATEVGNVDFADCTNGLTDFAATAGQAPGECTTIALASSNPGYNVNAVPAPPLKDVLQSAGPGC